MKTKSSTNKEKEIQREPRRKKEFVKFSVLDSFNSIALIIVTDSGYIYLLVPKIVELP